MPLHPLPITAYHRSSSLIIAYHHPSSLITAHIPTYDPPAS